MVNHLLMMINTDPNPSYPQLRLVSGTVALLAVFFAVSGMAGSGTVLAWAVAGIAMSIFTASFYLKIQ